MRGACLLLALPALTGDDAEDLRRFLAKYRSGGVDASVIGRLIPSLEPPAAFPAYERARSKMRVEPTARGAEVLLEAATLALADDPADELRRFAAQQPWVVRRRAIDELREYYTGEEIQDWALGRLADPALPLPERRVLVEYLGAALARRPREAVYGSLLEALEHPDPLVRAQAAAGLGDAVRPEDLEKLAQRLFDGDAGVRLKTVLAVRAALPRLDEGLAPEARRRLLQLLGSRLHDPDPHVRILAAELLREHPDPVLARPLVAALEEEERRAEAGEARLRFRTAVEDLLRAVHGAGSPSWSAEQWRRWIDRHGSSEAEARAGEPGRTVSGPVHRTYATYFGREVRSSHVVFVVDFSGSMIRPTGTVAHDEGEGKRDPRARIRVALGAFADYLRALDETNHFNVVLFAAGSRAAFDDLVPATPDNKARARAFVASVPLGGSTDLFSGILRGLRCAGLDAGERFGTRADTVYLLSDGVPTAGAVTDPGDIVRIVTKLNEFSGLSIHVVDVGARHSAYQAHLRELAERNGGEYIRVEGDRAQARSDR